MTPRPVRLVGALAAAAILAADAAALKVAELCDGRRYVIAPPIDGYDDPAEAWATLDEGWTT